LSRVDSWGYRIPFALQWIWPVPLIVGCILAPESPWWLVRKGRTEDAIKSVKRLTYRTKDIDFEAEKTVAMMAHTHKLEVATTSGASVWDCFRGVDLRRTEIACIVWAIQNISQSPLNGAYFFNQAGLPSTDSFDLTMGQYGSEVLGTIFAWAGMTYFGRRTLYLWGLVSVIVVYIIMGALGCAKGNADAIWAAGAMVIVNYFIYSVTIGTVTYSLVPEISSGRLRTRTIILARNLYNVVGIINGVLTSYMINQTAWNWGAKSAFFYCGLNVIALVWTYYRLPEPKGRTFAELDMLFAKKVPARQFKTTFVDPFEREQKERDQGAVDYSTPIDNGLVAPTVL